MALTTKGDGYARYPTANSLDHATLDMTLTKRIAVAADKRAGVTEGTRLGPTRIYVAATCLQGEDIPAHVRWTPGPIDAVRVALPPELAFKEVYNVPSESIEVSRDRSVRFSGFRVPGFLGLVLSSHTIDTGKKEIELTFETLGKQGEVLQKVARKVLIFRPLLRSEALPDLPVKVATDEYGVFHAQPGLSFSNIGDGTALVYVQVSDSKDVKITHPTRIDEFVKRYRDDLLRELHGLRTDFPKFGGLLDGFIAVVERDTPPSPSTKKELRRLSQRLESAFRESNDFLDALVGAIGRAFFKNLRVITEMHSFLDFLNSAGYGRVILMNALDSFHFVKGGSMVKLRLHVTDLEWGTYPPVDFGPLVLVSEFTGEMPVYALFSWAAPQKSGG